MALYNRLIIGLSGGIGSGKTTVGKIFENFGVLVVDADDVARAVVAKGSIGLSKIAEHFGEDYILANGDLDRSKLRHRIFTHEADKIWLEQLTHPLIREQTEQLLLSQNSPYAIYISPLLIEKGIPDWLDRVLIIDCDEAQQLARVTVRDQNSTEQVSAIMKNQASREQRLALADDVILNNGKPEDLTKQITELHNQYLTLADQNT